MLSARSFVDGLPGLLLLDPRTYKFVAITLAVNPSLEGLLYDVRITEWKSPKTRAKTELL